MVVVPEACEIFRLSLGAVSEVRVVDTYEVNTITAENRIRMWYQLAGFTVPAPGAIRYITLEPQPDRSAQRTYSSFGEIRRNIALICFRTR